MKLGKKRGKEDGAPLKDWRRQLVVKKKRLLMILMRAKKPLQFFETPPTRKMRK